MTSAIQKVLYHPNGSYIEKMDSTPSVIFTSSPLRDMAGFLVEKNICNKFIRLIQWWTVLFFRWAAEPEPEGRWPTEYKIAVTMKQGRESETRLNEAGGENTDGLPETAIPCHVCC